MKCNVPFFYLILASNSPLYSKAQLVHNSFNNVLFCFLMKLTVFSRKKKKLNSRETRCKTNHRTYNGWSEKSDKYTRVIKCKNIICITLNQPVCSYQVNK